VFGLSIVPFGIYNTFCVENFALGTQYLNRFRLTLLNDISDSSAEFTIYRTNVKQHLKLSNRKTYVARRHLTCPSIRVGGKRCAGKQKNSRKITPSRHYIIVTKYTERVRCAEHIIFTCNVLRGKSSQAHVNFFNFSCARQPIISAFVTARGLHHFRITRAAAVSLPSPPRRRRRQTLAAGPHAHVLLNTGDLIIIINLHYVRDVTFYSIFFPLTIIIFFARWAAAARDSVSTYHYIIIIIIII